MTNGIMIFLINNFDLIGTLLWQHLQMVAIALCIATAIAVPLALVINRWSWIEVPLLSTLGMLYTIPSLALIILLVPWLGLSATSVIAAMVIYAQVILVRNLLAGLRAIPASTLETATAMGMNSWQRWWWVQVPLALPVFLAGLRLAALVSIAIATIGAKFGAGGLGILLFEGIAQSGRYDKIWAGAIAVSLLALSLHLLFLALERQTATASGGAS